MPLLICENCLVALLGVCSIEPGRAALDAARGTARLPRTRRIAEQPERRVHRILTVALDTRMPGRGGVSGGRCVMFEELIAVFHSIGVTLLKTVPVSVALGAAFTVLSFFWACNPGRPWWRKRELLTDLCYWFIIPLFARYLRIGLLVIGAALLFGITTGEGLVELYDDGHGPLSQLPLWLQAAIFLIGSDLMMYWIHRAFHHAPLWKYHAVHHSSEDLDWISAARFHPVNIFLGSVATDVALLLAGISPNVLVLLGPFTVAHSAFVHANLNWTLGPFKYVLAGPVFHRWHHTMAERGGDKNFAATFPVLDLMFGTFYMPKHELPDAYGIADRGFPPSFGAQMLYPFRQ
jgi:sterol desaturase/sphingolipid hydroxylase (fatty acid hydroxylase superfamily)